MSAPLRLTDPEAALTALLAAIPGPVAPRRRPVAEAIGRILAEPLVAPGPMPPAPTALRDGWAVAAADTLGAGPYAPLPLPARPAWVAAGDALPPGADAVLPAFDLTDHGPPLFAEALQAVAPGEGARMPGEDLPAGAVLRAAGERLAPRDLPSLAACGIAEPAVRAPRVAWIATGDEIVAEPARDTLAPAFAALLAAEGADTVLAPPAPDDAEAIADALRAAAPGADLLLLAGGTGEGREDRSAAGLAAAGRLSLHGIGARPGSTAGYGTVEDKPVILLPGRAEDAVAAWLLLARPALRRLSGAVAKPPRRARLTRKVASMVGMAELVPLRFTAADEVEPLAVGTLPLGALGAAEAALMVPPGAEGYEAGSLVDLLEL